MLLDQVLKQTKKLSKNRDRSYKLHISLLSSLILISYFLLFWQHRKKIQEVIKLTQKEKKFHFQEHRGREIYVNFFCAVSVA